MRRGGGGGRRANGGGEHQGSASAASTPIVRHLALRCQVVVLLLYMTYDTSCTSSTAAVGSGERSRNKHTAHAGGRRRSREEKEAVSHDVKSKRNKYSKPARKIKHLGAFRTLPFLTYGWRRSANRGQTPDSYCGGVPCFIISANLSPIILVPYHRRIFPSQSF